MAIGNSDGSITLSVQVDKASLESALKGVESGSKKSGKKISTNFKQIGATISKGFALAATAATAAIAGITKQSVSAYAEYEQLVGGVETLFKGAADKIKAYAEDAFYTAGLSANEYMQQVTSFSASLISSCAGDTEKAADIANMALIDISDNVNKMGSTQESVTMAYQGFAKQQYMLLDNLKLGYGGTKTEMERLLKDAQAITGVKYDIDNLADVYTALHVIQHQLGITGTTEEEAEKTISGSAKMAKASWQNVLAAISGGGDLDRAINNLVFSITKLFQNLSPVVQQALIGIGDAIEGIAPMLAQNVAVAIIQSIPSVVHAVYSMFLGAAKGIWQGIKAVFMGKSVGGTITAQLNKQTSETDAMANSIGAGADNQDELTKGVKGTNKELKKTLAGFDDLQILTDNSRAGGSGGKGASGGGVDTSGVGGGFGEIEQEQGDGGVDVNPWLTAIKGLVEVLVGVGMIALGIILCTKGSVKWGISCIIFGLMSIGAGLADLQEAFDASKAKEILLIVTGINGLLLLSIGCILLFTGHIPWGIGAIISGLAMLAVTAYEAATKLNTQEIMTFLSTFMAFLGGALLALGVFLCWMNCWPMGIACIIAGASSLGVSAYATSQNDGSEVTNWLLTILTVISGALLALGIILCVFGGFSPLAIGLIIAGATLLAVSLVNQSDTIPGEVQKWVNLIFTIVSAAALVLGIIMMCAGQFTPLSIGLVIVGAAGLAAEIAVNWEWLKTKLGEEIGIIAGVVSAALLVLGIIILLASGGAALPLGLALIIAGAAGLVTVVAANWDGIVDKVKEVWQKIKDFWNDHVKKVFTKEWWENLAKKCGNGLISAFESAVNGVIGLFEKMINFIVKGLNKISFDVPDWVPGVGGKTFGFDLQEASLGRVSIPRLAKGAVIPANREFLAVLGDQKKGVNIEAPLQTIVDAFNIALSQRPAETSQGNTIVVLELDGRELGRAVVEQGNKESRRIGTRLVIA